MNEEFGVLKNMVPACKAMEMPKLAILQAGIEYIQYMESCVAQLKAENEGKGKVGTPRVQMDKAKIGGDVESVPNPSAEVRANRHIAMDDWSLRDSRKSLGVLLNSSSYSSLDVRSQGHVR